MNPKEPEPPRPYREWRRGPYRAEDAANTLGYCLIRFCREKAMKRAAEKLASGAGPAAASEEAIDIALHNILNLLEGFWEINSGPDHTVDFALIVRILNSEQQVVEDIEISPSLLDLPIGYWKWRDGGFR